MDNISLRTDEYINQILAKHSNMVYRVALSQTKNKQDADDVFQEVFLRLIKKDPQFQNYEHEKAWLIRVTINCSKKIFSSAWFKKTSPLKDELSFTTKEKSDVYYAVIELPRKYRIVIYLYYYEEYSVLEMSQILSLKESTVKTHLYRGRKLLEEKLEGGFEIE